MTFARVIPQLSGPLCLGSHGEDVKELQQELNDEQIGAMLSVDGRFGKTTHTALVEFQRRMGLKADGVVGPKTAEVLGWAYHPGRVMPYVVKMEEPPRSPMTPPLKILIDTILAGMKPIETEVVYAFIETPTAAGDPRINLKQRDFVEEETVRLERTLMPLTDEVPDGNVAVTTVRTALQTYVNNVIDIVETMDWHSNAGYLWRFPDVIRQVPVDVITSVVDRVLRGQQGMTMALAQLHMAFENVKMMLDMMPRVDANGRHLGETMADVEGRS